MTILPGGQLRPGSKSIPPSFLKCPRLGAAAVRRRCYRAPSLMRLLRSIEASNGGPRPGRSSASSWASFCLSCIEDLPAGVGWGLPGARRRPQLPPPIPLLPVSFQGTAVLAIITHIVYDPTQHHIIPHAEPAPPLKPQNCPLPSCHPGKALH